MTASKPCGQRGREALGTTRVCLGWTSSGVTKWSHAVKQRLDEQVSHHTRRHDWYVAALKDFSLYKPSKSNRRRKWDEWLMSGNHTYTSSGSIRKPYVATMCQWIKEAQEEIIPALVVKSFLKCCISNALGGSEDGLIRQEETELPSPFSSKLSEDNADLLCSQGDLMSVNDIITTLFEDDEDECVTSF